ncbi:MAG: immunoglobulin domain-containing protein [Opitutaceae bacterium]|nr:immunoglobulin domain-containing protein [Opitutaceae bacterium]
MKTCRPLVRWSGARARLVHPVGVLVLAMSLLSALAEGQVTYTPYTFTTLAGQASIGTADGAGEVARFSSPFDVAVDGAGNLYVADTDNHTVRKIAPGGMVTTLAGLAGVSGFADGAGSAARFSAPESVAVDAAGNVFVSELWSGTIRKITPAGVVTTVARFPGSSDPAAFPGSATGYGPAHDLAVDTDGNLYATNALQNAILKITPDGTVTTLAGSPGIFGGDADGTGSAARFARPRGLVLGPTGDIYVADTANNAIRKVTLAGVVTTLAGPNDLPDGFYMPKSLVTDAAGNFIVVDSWNLIWRFGPSGELTKLMTLATPTGYGDAGYADGLAMDQLGSLYVADTANSAIRKLSPSGTATTVAGFGPAYGSADGAGSAARFFYPLGMAADEAGNVYVADTANHTIRKITSGGIVTTLAGLAGTAGDADGVRGDARFNAPSAVAVDPAGTVYVADTGNYTIRKITPAGVVSTLAGAAGSSDYVDATGSAARFVSPHSIAADREGNVWVADYRSTWTFDTYREIRRIAPGGQVTTVAQVPDSRAPAKRSHVPLAITIDGAGNLFAADLYSSVIWKVAPGEPAAIIAGAPADCGGDSVDGPAAASRFTAPAGVAADAAGNVYVADCHAIRRIGPDGAVTTLAGVSKLFGSADGTGSAARFNAPTGIAVDSTGRLTVADTDSHTIRLGVVASAPVILSQPQSRTVSIGANVQFSVTVSGSPEPTLQWSRNGSAISGATGSTLTLTGIQASDAGDYTLTAENALGRVTSDRATLTVSTAAGGTPSGGGTMEAGFVGVLVLLAMARKLARGGETPDTSLTPGSPRTPREGG